jgi:hypothetical protein
MTGRPPSLTIYSHRGRVASRDSQEEQVGKLKHQRRSQPRRPTEGAKSRAKQRRAAAASQGKLDRWYLGRSQ